jgi:phosphoribosylpyrophosphate synthetase
LTGIDTICYPTGANIVDNLPRIKELAKAFKRIKEFKGRSVNLICRGSSGAIIAAIFANELKYVNTKIIHVKKAGESSHGSKVSRLINDGVNVIVDDFIGTGKTVRQTYKDVVRERSFDFEVDAVCVTGAYHDFSKTFVPKYFICSKMHD